MSTPRRVIADAIANGSGLRTKGDEERLRVAEHILKALSQNGMTIERSA